MTRAVPVRTPEGNDIRGALQRLADDLVSPGNNAPAGCVLGIDVAGARTVVSAGSASREASEPMRRDTLFDLASVSKVVGTTTCLHRLASMRALDVGSRVKRLVPSFGGSEDTTVRDLLQHRGGLWEWQPIYLGPGGREDPFRVVDALPLRYPAGRQRHYSDLGFITLGRIIETIFQASLDAAVQELVVDPLGLESLRYGPVAGHVATSGDGDKVERAMVATGDPYPVLWPDDGFPWRSGPIRGVVNDGNSAHAFGGIAGHAGLFSRVDDLLDVGSALSTASDSPSLWDRDVTADFYAAGEDPEQALGWRRGSILLAGDPHPLLWHPGFTGTVVAFVPEAHIAIAFAANRLLADQPQPTAVMWQRVLAALTPILGPQE